MIFWSDSVYLDNPDHDFHCDMLWQWKTTTAYSIATPTTIARGTVNPMRFFQYNLIGTEVTDNYILSDT